MDFAVLLRPHRLRVHPFSFAIYTGRKGVGAVALDTGLKQPKVGMTGPESLKL